MKPSEIVVQHTCPFLDTFGKSEFEVTVALLVMACGHHGDKFKALAPQQIGEALRAAVQHEPWKSWNRNPFFRPNIRDLVEAGFAEFLGDPEAGCPVRLTQTALARLRKKWWKPNATAASNVPTGSVRKDGRE